MVPDLLTLDPFPLPRRAISRSPASRRSLAAWLLACGSAAALHTGCTVRDGEPTASVTRAATVQSAPDAALSKAQVDDLVLARWRAWDRAAADLPDGYVLSIELLQPRPGHGFAVFTVVKDHRAIQNLVGQPSPADFAAADDPASTDIMAGGDPPPKQPPPPGIAVQGGALLYSIAYGDPPPKQPTEPGITVQGGALLYSIAYGEPPPKQGTEPGIAAQGDALLNVIALGQPPQKEPPPPGIAASAGATSNGVPIGEPPPKEPPQPGVTAGDDVRTYGPITNDVTQAVDRMNLARWHAWEQLAADLPDRHALSVELLHPRPDRAFAVLTVVKSGAPVQYVVGAGGQPVALAADDDPASAEAIALGEPPPKAPPEPGIVASGAAILVQAFGSR